MAISLPPDCRAFKAGILHLFVNLVLIGLIGLMCVVRVIDGPHFDRLAFAAGAVSVPFSSLLLAWLTSRFFRTGLSAEGLYGQSFWGRQSFVRWRDIAAVRTFRVLNLRWLRIQPACDGSATWLALFPSNRAAFREEIRRLAPPDSPVLSHIR